MSIKTQTGDSLLVVGEGGNGLVATQEVPHLNNVATCTEMEGRGEGGVRSWLITTACQQPGLPPASPCGVRQLTEELSGFVRGQL